MAMNAIKEASVKRALALSISVALLAIAPAVVCAQGYVVIRNLTEEDGYFPVSTLVQDSNDFFFGTASAGGDAGAGTVFKVDANNNFVVLHHFDGATDGGSPRGSLILGSDGYLYGTTDSGGANEFGTIYKLDTDGNNFAVIHDFELGSFPYVRSLVLDPVGTLFGPTGGLKEVFRMDTDGSNYSILYPFAPGEGEPATLLLGSDGFLYGTTFGPRTVFRLGRDGLNFATLHTFEDEDIAQPLIEGADGFLYGTAIGGGQYSGGAVFKLRKDGSSFAFIHDFQGSEGTSPEASVTQVAGGLLYGTASGGGTGGGTIFRLTTSGALFGSVHDFDDPTGDTPRRALLQGQDGALYGTTTSGGTSGAIGVVYRLSIPTIASVSPSSGPAGGGTIVTISGSGFQTGAAVAIGGSLAGAVIGPGEITANTPPLTAGTLNAVLVTNPDDTLALDENAWLADFLDVPQSDPFHDFVEQIVRHGITSGCGGGNYCGGDSVTRAQMAVFLLKAKHGPNYVPPPCASLFPDVACPSLFADWVEQLAAESITAGCTGGNYCPGNAVTRAQMAVFLLKTEHGSSYVPPACTGTFEDVTCPSLFADWIERLAAENVTGGCGGGNYCPTNPNTRGQMAVFLAKTFGLLP
jgi:uncharacterized repeat protein (TIGR03803 family)